MIQFACPSCAAVFSVGDEKAGKTGKCPKCDAKFVIPDAEPGAAPSPPPVDDNVEIKPCPGCQAKLTVEKSDLGLDVECPYCKTVYKATKAGGSSAVIRMDRPNKRSAPVEDDEDDRPRRRRRDEEEDEDDRPSKRTRRENEEDDEDDRPRRRSRRDDDDDDYDRPRRKRSSRGSRSAAQNAVNGPAMFLLVLGILGLLYGVANLVFSLLGFGPRAAQLQQQNAMAPVSMLVGAVLPLIWGAIVTLAGFKMKSLSSRGSCYFGAIFAMLPCSPCCLIGIAAGIWAIVVLGRDDVKRAFDS